MDKESILKNYATLGINSQNGIFDFIVNNSEATVGDRHYNLTNSNEIMEFMANFFYSLGFEVIRLYLEKNASLQEKRHWFLAFNNGSKWFYYESINEKIKGKHVFSNYNSLINYATAKNIQALENDEAIDFNVYEQYVLKEIISLPNFDLEDDIRISKDGNEILLWNGCGSNDYNVVIKNAEKEEVINRNYNDNADRSVLFFVVGFISTLVIGIALVWILAQIYLNN